MGHTLLSVYDGYRQGSFRMIERNPKMSVHTSMLVQLIIYIDDINQGKMCFTIDMSKLLVCPLMGNFDSLELQVVVC